MGTSIKMNLALRELPYVEGIARGRRAAVPHRDHGAEPVHPGHGRPAGAGRAGHPRRPRPHRAVLPDRARPVARAGGQAHRHDRRELAALPAPRGIVGRDQGGSRGPGDRDDRRVLPEASRSDRASSGRHAARHGAADGAHGRARAPRRHGPRPTAVPAADARMGELPHADRRSLPVRRGHPSGRRRLRRERSQRGARGPARRAAARARGARR